MCAVVGVGKRTMSPGSLLIYRHGDNFELGNWGSHGIYNARIESFNYTWKQSIRVICPVDTFYEGGKAFGIVGEKINLGAIIAGNGLLIVTRDATDLVKPHHGRMPLIVKEDKIEDWFNRWSQNYYQIDYNRLKLVA